jgi:hypothetical protein
MEGIAFDIAMTNHDPEAFEAAARAVGFQGFGFYPRSGFSNCLEVCVRKRARPWAARRPLPPHGARRCAQGFLVVRRVFAPDGLLSRVSASMKRLCDAAAGFMQWQHRGSRFRRGPWH